MIYNHERNVQGMVHEIFFSPGWGGVEFLELSSPMRCSSHCLRLVEKKCCILFNVLDH